MREAPVVGSGQDDDLYLPRTLFSREVPLLVDANFGHVACGHCKGVRFSAGGKFDCLMVAEMSRSYTILIWSKLPKASFTSLSENRDRNKTDFGS